MIFYLYSKYQKNIAFLKNINSWQEFYTTACRGGHDKFQLCTLYFPKLGKIRVVFFKEGGKNVTLGGMKSYQIVSVCKPYQKNQTESKCGLMTRG